MSPAAAGAPAGGPDGPVHAPHWRAHLPPGMDPAEVDLAAGRTLPGAWTAAWAADPARPVLVTADGGRVGAAELAERTAAAAGRYAAAGLEPGDRLVMSAVASVDLVVAYVAALRYGLTVVPVNTAYSGPELAAVVAGAKPALALLDEADRATGLELRCCPPDLAGLPAGVADPPLDAARPDDVALVVYTSGTTGQPKGAPLTHANLLASVHAVRLAWRWTPQDRLALCLPLFHVHGLGVGLHGTLAVGGCAVVLPRFTPAGVAEAVTAHGATMFFGVPTMYHRLAESPYLADLRRLRLAVSGSAPLPAQLHAAVAAGSGQQVLERYGMTETMMLVSNPYAGPRRPGTVGLPLPGVSVRLRPQPGGVAEIEVRGPNVISGYLDSPEASAAAFTPDGWFRTGDLGVLDEDGYLTISGRAKELIITGGYNVYPREVEEVLRSHPGVADAAVVGAPSTEWGEAVVAFVVPAAGDPGPPGGGPVQPSGDPSWSGGASGPPEERLERLREQLEEWCAGRLAPYKRPRVWRWVDAVPRNPLGKVLRHRLVP
ncbi:MAG TPA: AMP-binding protein [Micromonosporaceae bacterium]|nr:AMP-binding protein [Micromonosporaceae bacterium]